MELLFGIKLFWNQGSQRSHKAVQYRDAEGEDRGQNFDDYDQVLFEYQWS